MNMESMIGIIKINNKTYNTNVIGTKCTVKCDDFENIKKINGKWIIFYCLNDSLPMEETNYCLFLENIRFINLDVYNFDIVYSYLDRNERIMSISFGSIALTNFYNEKFLLSGENDSEKYLEYINNLMQKNNIYEIHLPFGNYKFIFENSFIISNEDGLVNNIMPFVPQTLLTIEKENGTIDGQDLCNLIKYFHNFNRFVTLNKYTKIDCCTINYEKCTSPINILKGYEKTCIYHNGFVFSDFADCIKIFLENNGNFLKHSDNMYPFEEDVIYAYDIVRVSGAFEKIFEKYIEKDNEYINFLNKIKKEVHFDEFKILVKDFEKRYNLNNNVNFQNMYRNFTRFGTLKQKIDFVLSKFFIIMGIEAEKIESVGLFYSPTDLSVRFKKARDDISHGLENERTNWYGASKDLFFVQQLIHFVILKYKINVPDESIKETLNRIYHFLNITLK